MGVTRESLDPEGDRYLQPPEGGTPRRRRARVDPDEPLEASVMLPSEPSPRGGEAPDAYVDDEALVSEAMEEEEEEEGTPVPAPPATAQPSETQTGGVEVAPPIEDETIKLRTALAAEQATARAAREYALRLESLVGTLNKPPPGPPVEDPVETELRSELQGAGIDPAKIDAFVAGRLERTFKQIGDRLEAQKRAHLEATARVAEDSPGFDETRVELFMKTAPPAIARSYAQMLEKDREGALRMGWALAEAGSPRETPPAPLSAAPTTPPAGNPRATASGGRPKVATPAPGAGQTWREMSPEQRGALVRAISNAPDGSEEEKRLLKVRFGGTSMDREDEISRYMGTPRRR
jgi:hypothetical protein